MIQRKQTLFLLLLVCSGIALLFVPGNLVLMNESSVPVTLFFLQSSELVSSSWHYLATLFNFVAILLGLICIFLYKKRNLQIKMCYALMLIELVITVVCSYAYLVVKNDALFTVKNTHYGSMIGVVGMMAAYLAARFVKKDIELLRNADRIR
jgi:hypothetical protein